MEGSTMSSERAFTCILATRWISSPPNLQRASTNTWHFQPEKDRMDIYHQMFLVARRQELHCGRIDPDAEDIRILDLGTGTGIWAIDMAEYVSSSFPLHLVMLTITLSRYPKAEVRSPFSDRPFHPYHCVLTNYCKGGWNGHCKYTAQ